MRLEIRVETTPTSVLVEASSLVTDENAARRDSDAALLCSIRRSNREFSAREVFNLLLGTSKHCSGVMALLPADYDGDLSSKGWDVSTMNLRRMIISQTHKLTIDPSASSFMLIMFSDFLCSPFFLSFFSMVE